MANPLKRAWSKLTGRRRIKRRLKTYAGYDGKLARARRGTRRRKRSS